MTSRPGKSPPAASARGWSLAWTGPASSSRRWSRGSMHGRVLRTRSVWHAATTSTPCMCTSRCSGRRPCVPAATRSWIGLPSAGGDGSSWRTSTTSGIGNRARCRSPTPSGRCSMPSTTPARPCAVASAPRGASGIWARGCSFSWSAGVSRRNSPPPSFVRCSGTSGSRMSGNSMRRATSGSAVGSSARSRWPRLSRSRARPRRAGAVGTVLVCRAAAAG